MFYRTTITCFIECCLVVLVVSGLFKTLLCHTLLTSHFVGNQSKTTIETSTARWRHFQLHTGLQTLVSDLWNGAGNQIRSKVLLGLFYFHTIIQTYLTF